MVFHPVKLHQIYHHLTLISMPADPGAARAKKNGACRAWR